MQDVPRGGGGRAEVAPDAVAETPHEAGDVHHSVLLPRTTGELVEAVVPYVRAGLARGDAVQVNLVARRVADVEAALGADAERVCFTDTDAWQPSPGRRLRALEDALAAVRAQGGHLRLVGECAWPIGMPAALVAEWERYDAVLNEALAGEPIELLCVYDAASLPAAVLEHAARLHPEHGVAPASPNGSVVGAATLAAELAPEALAVPGGAEAVSGSIRPPAGRAFVRSTSLFAQLDDAVRQDLLVMVSELVTNAWRAAASSVGIAFWRAAHGLVLQVDDDGTGLGDLLAGYRRPPTSAEGGRGLWIIRQLADAVEVASSPGRTSLRAHVARP